MKRRVLIIDDEISLRRALQNALEKEGYSVTTLGSKKELTQIAQNLHFDLALVDMILPDGNGIELIPLLKKYYKNIKINILTGHGSIDTAIQAMKEGAFHFFTKPFSVNEVLNICEKAYNQTQLEKRKSKSKSLYKKTV